MCYLNISGNLVVMISAFFISINGGPFYPVLKEPAVDLPKCLESILVLVSPAYSMFY